MAFSELELKRCEKAVEAFMQVRRPARQIRNEVDLRYRIKGQSIELFEVRPDWHDPEKTVETPVAKATYVPRKASGKSTGCGPTSSGIAVTPTVK